MYIVANPLCGVNKAHVELIKKQTEMLYIIFKGAP